MSTHTRGIKALSKRGNWRLLRCVYNVVFICSPPKTEREISETVERPYIPTNTHMCTYRELYMYTHIHRAVRKQNDDGASFKVLLRDVISTSLHNRATTMPWRIISMHLYSTATAPHPGGGFGGWGGWFEVTTMVLATAGGSVFSSPSVYPATFPQRTPPFADSRLRQHPSRRLSHRAG